MVLSVNVACYVISFLGRITYVHNSRYNFLIELLWLVTVSCFYYRFDRVNVVG
jgi:hypothetical protein